MRDVFGSEIERLPKIIHCRVHRLPGQAEHQVEIDIIEAGRARRGERLPGLDGIVDTPQGLQLAVVEALYADRQAIDSGFAITAVISGIGAAGIRFEGDLDARREVQQRPQPGKQPFDRGRRKQRRGAATDEDRFDRPPPDQRQILLEILEQCIYVSLLRDRVGLV